MHPLLCVVASLALACAPQAQRVQWLSDHALAIQCIDPDDEEDFSDLEPLKALIGESRIVVLGEPSHGDGAVFYAKARLIKFLHQRMGFDVLAWESGMFDCREVDRAMRNPEMSALDAARRGIFGVWTASAQAHPTLDYVRATIATDRPIESCGFDHQFSAGGSTPWPAQMVAFVDAVDSKALENGLRQRIITNFQAAFGQRPVLADIEALRAALDELRAIVDQRRAALVTKHGQREFDFMCRTIDDVEASLNAIEKHVDRAMPFDVRDNNLRDTRMAENLIWLAKERYKNRKIIVWAATMHAVHDIQKIRPVDGPPLYEGVINCGTLTRQMLGHQMYTIGFTAYDGECGWAIRGKPRPLAAPRADSLEDLCRRTGKQFLFIDFRSLPADHWLHESLVSRPLGYSEMNAQWPRQMDAMMYIKTMFPSTRENALPRYARTRVQDR